MAATFHGLLHFPIWQGAGAPYGYATGARVLRDVAKGRGQPLIDVPVTVDDFSSTEQLVKAAETLETHFSRAEQAVQRLPFPSLVLGGDCVADFIPVARALEKYGSRMALLWIDAHPDINTPSTSPSGNFHGMLVRALMGDAPDRFTCFVKTRLTAQQLFYVGIRPADMDEEEFRIIAERKIDVTAVEAINRGDYLPLIQRLQKQGFTHLYLHVDSDVLALEDYPQAVVAVEGGIKLERLVKLLQVLRANFSLAGGALTEYSLSSPPDEVDVLRAKRLLVDGFGL